MIKKKLSIIIVTHNSEKHIFDCLESLLKYNDIGDLLEIIVVDNCSTERDNLFEKIREKFGDAITLIASPVNGGYGHGNNQGIINASAPLVAVMNPDIRILSPVFEKIIGKFKQHPGIGMLGVSFTDSTRSLYFKPEHSNLANMLFDNMLIRLGLYKLEKMFFSGSFLVFDKQTIFEAGLFDENIFLFHEEADISNRILKLNKDVVLANDIQVKHLAHGREVNQWLLKVGNESRNYYFDKYNADIKKYYKNLLVMYRIKYVLALITGNKLKAAEFKAWIDICINR